MWKAASWDSVPAFEASHEDPIICCNFRLSLHVCAQVKWHGISSSEYNAWENITRETCQLGSEFFQSLKQNDQSNKTDTASTQTKFETPPNRREKLRIESNKLLHDKSRHSQIRKILGITSPHERSRMGKVGWRVAVRKWSYWRHQHT